MLPKDRDIEEKTRRDERPEESNYEQRGVIEKGENSRESR